MNSIKVLGSFALLLLYGAANMIGADPILAQVSNSPVDQQPVDLIDSGSRIRQTEMELQIGEPIANPLKPGDRIQLTVVDFPELSGDQTIGSDGTIQLPLAGAIAVGGLTLNQAVAQVTQSLLPYVRRPQVGLVVVSQSPLHISVTGEVVQPGPLLSPTNADQTNAPITLSQALLLAGGIKPDADLRNITIRRNVADPGITRSLSSSTKTEITVNLWQVIQSGDLTADVRIYNGDEIIVPKAASSSNQQMLLTSSIAPEEITVQVAGEVQNPGQIKLNPTVGLSGAIAAAGGLTDDAREDDIVLFRMLPDGRLEESTYAFGEPTEPLRNGDLVFVDESERGKTGDVFDFIGRVVSPVSIFLRLLTGF